MLELQPCDLADLFTNQERERLQQVREKLSMPEMSPSWVKVVDSAVDREAARIMRERTGDEAVSTVKEVAQTALTTRFDADVRRVHLTLPYEVWDRLQAQV